MQGTMIVPQGMPVTTTVAQRDGVWFAPLDDSSLPNTASFARASTGSVRKGVNVLGTAAVDLPRFEVEPVTGFPRGILLEGTGSNYARSTVNLADAWWVKLNATVAASAVVSSDGVNVMYKLVETNSNAEHSFHKSFTVTAGRYFAVSVDVKAAERGKFGILFSSNSNAHICLGQFDLGTGVAASQLTGSAEVREVGMNKVNSDTYRCYLIGRAGPTDTSIRVGFCLLDSASNRVYSGDGTSGILVAMPQIEMSFSQDICTTYIPNSGTTSDLTRSADVLRWTDLRPLGILPERGTFVMDVILASVGLADSGNYRCLLELALNTNNRLNVFYTPGQTQKVLCTYRKNGVLTSLPATGTESLPVLRRHRVAVSYGDTLAVSVDGQAVYKVAGSTANSWSELRLGSSGFANMPLGGWMARVAYYPSDQMDTRALSAL